MKRYIKYIVFIILLILPITDFMFNSSEASGDTLNRYSFLLRIILLTIVCFSFVLDINGFLRVFYNPVIRAFGFVVGYIVLHYLFTYDSSDEISSLIKVVYNFIILFYFYQYAYSNDINDKEIKWLYAILGILYFVSILSFVGLRSTLRSTGLAGFADNRGYALVGCVPMLLLFYKERKFPILLLIFSVGIFIAGKRGAIISLLFTLLIMFAFLFLGKRISGSTKVLYSLVIIAGVILLFSFYNELISAAFTRFGNLAEDGGSGRNRVYMTYWKGFLNSDIIGTIFGNGFHGGIKNLNITVLAHSDIFEILYDYGVVGTILYTNIFYQIGRYLYWQFTIKNIYFYILLCITFIMIIKSIISGTFLMTTETIIMYITVAYIIGNNDNKIELQEYGYE